MTGLCQGRARHSVILVYGCFSLTALKATLAGSICARADAAETSHLRKHRSCLHRIC